VSPLQEQAGTLGGDPLLTPDLFGAAHEVALDASFGDGEDVGAAAVPIVGGHESGTRDAEAGLLLHLAEDRASWSLASLDATAGKPPPAVRLLDHENAPRSADDDRKGGVPRGPPSHGTSGEVAFPPVGFMIGRRKRQPPFLSIIG
jgi:hypothetical protein